MRGFLVTLGILTTLSAAAAWGPVALASQSAAAEEPWTLSRTPWGDPDLQGKWSYATITPLERPNGQASKEILSGEEVAALNEGARTDADRRDGGADADLARAYNAYWYDRGKSIGRTSLIIDPPDGRLPALTAEGQRRQAVIGERGAYVTVRFVGRPPAAGTLHHLPRRAAAADGLQQHLRDLPDTRERRDSRREHPRRACHPARRASAPAPEHPPVERRFARALGRQHPGRRDDQLQPTDHVQVPGGRGNAAFRGALHPRRRGPNRFPLHDYGFNDVYTAVDGQPAAGGAARLPHLRVRVPRGELLESATC